jgi:hypothetical protein
MMPERKPKVRPVKLIAGVLFQKNVNLIDVGRRLVNSFGPIDHQSSIFDFIFTDYYVPEMGDHLMKQFYSFERLVMPDSLADI